LEAIDGVAIDDVEGLVAQLAQAVPGRVLELRLRRGGQPQTLPITVGESHQPQG
jgi:S1-C subfamily serine protease